MKISDLNEMELIVESHPFLKWDGWNVIYLEQDDMAYMNKDAIFEDNKWHKKTVYKFENNYWHIPKNILRKGYA